MKRLFLILWCICSVVCFFISCTRKPDKATLTIYCTTDVHGSLFDFDLKQNRPTLYSLKGIDIIEIIVGRLSLKDITPV